MQSTVLEGFERKTRGAFRTVLRWWRRDLRLELKDGEKLRPEKMQADKLFELDKDYLNFHSGLAICGMALLILTGEDRGLYEVNDAYLMIGAIIVMLLVELALMWHREPPSVWFGLEDGSTLLGLRGEDQGSRKVKLPRVLRALKPSMGLLAVGCSALVCAWIDWAARWPISAVGLWLSACLLVWFDFNGRVSRHYLVMAAVIYLTSFLPSLGLIPAYRMYADGLVLGTVVGLLMVIGGVLDYLLLRHYSRPAPTSLEEIHNE